AGAAAAALVLAEPGGSTGALVLAEPGGSTGALGGAANHSANASPSTARPAATARRRYAAGMPSGCAATLASSMRQSAAAAPSPPLGTMRRLSWRRRPSSASRRSAGALAALPKGRVSTRHSPLITPRLVRGQGAAA